MGLVYYIQDNSAPYETYIGGTTQSLSKRMTCHRRITGKYSNQTASRDIIARGDYSTGILEKVEGNLKEVFMRERFWVENTPNINRNKPIRLRQDVIDYDIIRNKWWKSFGTHRSDRANSNNILHISPNLFN